MSQGIKSVKEGYADGGLIAEEVGATPVTTMADSQVAAAPPGVTRSTLSFPDAPPGVYAGHYVPGRESRSFSPFGFAGYATGSTQNPFAQMVGLPSPEFIPMQYTPGRGYETVYGTGMDPTRFEPPPGDTGTDVGGDIPMTQAQKIATVKELLAAMAPQISMTQTGGGATIGDVTAQGGAGGAGGTASTGPVTATGGTGGTATTGAIDVTAQGGAGGSATGGTASTGAVTAGGATLGDVINTATGGTATGGGATLGDLTSGTTTPGTTAPGDTTPGTTTPGTAEPGTTPGTAEPGIVTPGITVPGTTPGTAETGGTTPSTVSPGTTPSTAEAGTPGTTETVSPGLQAPPTSGGLADAVAPPDTTVTSEPLTPDEATLRQYDAIQREQQAPLPTEAPPPEVPAPLTPDQIANAVTVETAPLPQSAQQQNLDLVSNFTGTTINYGSGVTGGALGGQTAIAPGDIATLRDFVENINPGTVLTDRQTGATITAQGLLDALNNLPPEQTVTPAPQPEVIDSDYLSGAGASTPEDAEADETISGGSASSEALTAGTAPGTTTANVELPPGAAPPTATPGPVTLDMLPETIRPTVSYYSNALLGAIQSGSPERARSMGEYIGQIAGTPVLEGLARVMGMAATAPLNPVSFGTFLAQMAINPSKQPSLSIVPGVPLDKVLGTPSQALKEEMQQYTQSLVDQYAGAVTSGQMSPGAAATAASQDPNTAGRLGEVLAAIEQAAKASEPVSFPGERSKAETEVISEPLGPVGGGGGDMGYGGEAQAAAETGGYEGSGMYARGGPIDMRHVADYLKREYARAYASGGYVPGKSGGMDDDVPAVIDGHRPARLSSGEFVFDAATVAALGDGNNEAGAKKLNQLRHAIRQKAYGHKRQPPKNYSLGDLVGMT